MNFYDVVKNRASIKKYKNTPIDKEKVNRMINSAMMAPSWKNNSSYKFILVNDNEEKEILSQSVINDTNEANNSILEAPMTAVIVSNPDESGEVGNKDYYLVDAAIAMEHFILAATNEGYGTCWIAAIDEDKIKKALNIPNSYKVIAMTPIGESGEGPNHNDKKDVRDFVFLNKYGNSYTENI